MRDVILVTAVLSIFDGNAQILPPGYPCEVIGAATPVNVTACRLVPDCSGAEAARFRSIDGTCNNLERDASWGSTGEAFSRLVKRNPLVVVGYPPQFYVGNTGRKLPNARAVSNAIHSGSDTTSSRGLTTMVMQFGQFLDHDITLTPEMNLCNPNSCPIHMEIDCCDFIDETEVPKSCYPIMIPGDDPFFSSLEPPAPRCLDLKRSQPSPCNYTEGDESTREQFNILTAFVDASQIYGSDSERADKLRSGEGGRLKGNAEKGEDALMPFADVRRCPDAQVGADEETLRDQFLSGDARANENPGLQAMHTMWFREHNRLADLVATADPSLDDEDVFQEARRLVGAQLQNIAYREWLPIILGPEAMSDFALDVWDSSEYMPNLSPNIFNAFATAAFRFGHSLVTSRVEMTNGELGKKPFNLTDHFFDTSLVCEGRLDDLVTGMCFQGAEQVDNIMSDGLRNRLFPQNRSRFGGDLAVRNIMRGRDHELASYNSYRVSCGLRRLPDSFINENQRRPAEFTADTWARFAEVYESPNDIELFPGGISELPVDGGVVGPTFACLLAEQFARIKQGDRYFFTHTNVNRKLRFCDSELSAIRARTIRDVICDNTNVTGVPFDSFRHDTSNGDVLIVPCSESNVLLPDLGCDPEPNDFDDKENETEDDFEELGDVVMLAGGHDGFHIMSSVELYSPNGTCQHNLTPLPAATYGLVLAYVETLDSVIACGGRTALGFVERACWRLDVTAAAAAKGDEERKGRWVRMEAETIQVRWMAAQATISGNLYVTGGWVSPYTSEFYDAKSVKWIDGPLLLGERKQHCMVAYGDDAFVIVGGRISGDSVELYNVTTAEWTPLAETLSYRDSHDCILLPNGEDILVFGGTIFSTVYNVRTGRSLYGIDTILSRDHGRAVELGEGRGRRILVLGGDSLTNRVEEFVPGIQEFMLVKPARLLEARTRFGVTKVPARLFRHLPGGCKS